MTSKHQGRLDRGAAAVEMALVLPLLLLLIFGMVDLGRLVYSKVELSSAAREGARIVALGGTGAQLSDRVVKSTSLTPVTITPTACPANPSLTSDGTVTLTATFDWITPIGAFANMFGSSSVGNSISIQAKGSMRCGG